MNTHSYASVVLATGICLASTIHCGAQPMPITRVTISPDLPTEVVDGAGANLPVRLNVSGPPFEFFDDFSWRSFIALNWPARLDQRGQADVTRKVSDIAGPRVWETWKSALETVPPVGVGPTDWTSFDGPTPCSSIPDRDSGKVRILASFTKFGDISQADFADLAGPLVCQNNTYAHYEIKVNEAEFTFIRNGKLYDRTVLDDLVIDPARPPLAFPNGSIEIKAAWRQFGPEESEASRARYYRIKAFVINYGIGECEEQELGLIGLHIVHKTPLRPQWVWSSFEHVDNVPAVGQPPSTGATFSLNDPSKPQVLMPTVAPTQVTEDTYLDKDGRPKHPIMQVIRELPISSATARMNVRYQEALRDTVWANYILVMTQWPTDTVMPAGDPFPSSTDGIAITNTTMETYFQSSISCMRCHDLARRSKLDFVFFPTIHATNRDPGPAGSPSRMFIELLRQDFRKAREDSAIARMELLGREP